MWKIVAILLLTATVILLARLVYQAPMVQTHLGAFVSDMRGGAAEHAFALADVCRGQGVEG